jgi:hypothetical protein
MGMCHASMHRLQWIRLTTNIWNVQDIEKPLRMGPVWDYNEAYGMCCGYPIEGFNNNGTSGPGISGGSAISPEGWRFNICANPERCRVDPSDGLSHWFRRLWQVRAQCWQGFSFS